MDALRASSNGFEALRAPGVGSFPAGLGSRLAAPRLRQFIKFCVVGGSGVFVDMGVLFLLADPRCLALNLTLSKICSAVAAMTSNFVWNELWTFRPSPPPSTLQRFNTPTRTTSGVFKRFLVFNGICGIGIGLAVLLLHLLHTWLGWHLYVSNFLASIVVTFWNVCVNIRFNWKPRCTAGYADTMP